MVVQEDLAVVVYMAVVVDIAVMVTHMAEAGEVLIRREMETRRQESLHTEGSRAVSEIDLAVGVCYQGITQGRQVTTSETTE